MPPIPPMPPIVAIGFAVLGYVVAIALALLSLRRFSRKKTRVGLAMLGIVLVLVALSCGVLWGANPWG